MDLYPNNGMLSWNNISQNYEKLNLPYIRKNIATYLKNKIQKRSILSLSKKNFTLLGCITLIDEILHPTKNYSLLCVSSNIYTFRKKINNYANSISLEYSNFTDMTGSNLEVHNITTEHNIIHNKYIHLIIISIELAIRNYKNVDNQAIFTYGICNIYKYDMFNSNNKDNIYWNSHNELELSLKKIIYD